jgi:hypothetical protein
MEVNIFEDVKKKVTYKPKTPQNPQDLNEQIELVLNLLYG